MKAKQIYKFIADAKSDQYRSVRSVEARYGPEVPHIKNKPTLEQFSLPEDAEEQLMRIDKANEMRSSDLSSAAAVIIAILILLYVAITYGVGVALGTGLVAALPYYVLMFEFLSIDKWFKTKPTEMHFRYLEYIKNVDCYNYWNNMKVINYWLSLDGHEFEHALAALYRKKGYKAEVTKAGGDNGIDIILTKGEEKLIVQCKAHKKTVGPAVARDFYGTMVHFGYEKGIIASTSGFTGGVFEFVAGKNIELVTMNDIIEMSKA